MGVYYNNGEIRTPKQIWYNIPNVGLKQVKEVYWNVNGNVKRVWPEDHVAYNGSSFEGVLSGGMITGLLNWPGTDYTYGGVGEGKRQYFNYSSDDHNVFDKKQTSGQLALSSSDYSSNGWQCSIGWRSVELVDLSPYKTIIVDIIRDNNKNNNTYGQSYSMDLVLIKSNNTLLKEINNRYTGTVTGGKEAILDVSSINESVYLGFSFHISFGSTHNNYHKYFNYYINKIEFKTS